MTPDIFKKRKRKEKWINEFNPKESIFKNETIQIHANQLNKEGG